MTNKPIWEVMLKTDFEGSDNTDEGPIELSVVQRTCHGYRSWGWGGEDKIILLDSYLGEETSREMLRFMKKYAQIICDDLNINGLPS